jgi:hypothetical protein
MTRNAFSTSRPGTSEPPRGPAAAEIASRFKTDKPAPDDATVQKWIHDYRTEKYGN